MSIYDITVKDAKGNDVSLSEYKGKVLLVVNTATRCVYTPQYKGLQILYKRYKDKGFEILDFPCNQFANQAPESDDEIGNFCTMNYGVTFRRFAKIDVNGENESPLYTALKAKRGGVLGNNIKWNFTKFLVNREGEVVERFASATAPEKLEKKIVELL
ncbi:MAG: glutathione peroxidase [Ruminococcus sp.]|uniref:glutathione peroxidase n=1 Tax=Ruminococcus sp. TaxID=41978 RepID=UPI0025CD3E9B|nr:glutathione peroxidase [Ruminococcus sp.]MBR0529852.1 glutathione peroxidase [Ruminococcus sp.]